MSASDRNIDRCPECGGWRWRGVCNVDVSLGLDAPAAADQLEEVSAC